MTMTHTDIDGTITKVQGKDTKECLEKLLKEKGFDETTLENIKKLTPPIIESTFY